MKIYIKLFVSLREYLPDDIPRQDKVELEIGDEETPYGLIERFNIPLNLAHLVMINGTYVAVENRDKAIFQQNDVFAVWPPVAGG